MKGIMFNTKYGLEQAVLRGNKTRTWRADENPRYKVGEIIAIKQSYKHIITTEPKEWLFNKHYNDETDTYDEGFDPDKLSYHDIVLNIIKELKANHL